MSVVPTELVFEKVAEISSNFKKLSKNLKDLGDILIEHQELLRLTEKAVNAQNERIQIVEEKMKNII